MKFGHHGANHPVKDLDTGRVSITSQNHGFAVDEATLAFEPAAPRMYRCLMARLQGLALHRQAGVLLSRSSRSIAGAA